MHECEASAVYEPSGEPLQPGHVLESRGEALSCEPSLVAPIGPAELGPDDCDWKGHHEDAKHDDGRGESLPHCADGGVVPESDGGDCLHHEPCGVQDRDEGADFPDDLAA